MAVGNDEVARLLNELAALTEIEDGSPQSFRVRAYRNAVRAVAGAPRDVTAMTATELTRLPGIGASIAKKIRELAETGSVAKLDELRGRFPPGQLELLRIPGLGPKTVTLLWQVLGIGDLASLREAIEAGRLRDLPGMGERTEENLRDAIERLSLHDSERRTPILQVMPLARAIVASLTALPEVDRVETAGSLRRFRDTIRDLDVLVSSRQPATVIEAFCRNPDMAHIQGRGDTKASAVTFGGIQVDLRVVPDESFGAALLYFTGSKAHNIRLRERAVRRGWTLNEYALSEVEGGSIIASATEEEIYEALGLHWVTPELREDSGEIALAEEGLLPPVLQTSQLRGDLHDHTTASGDGRCTLEELVEAAAARGLEYLATTDHAENLTINGMNRAAMLAQRRQVRELEQQRGDITLLHGAELNIGIDGSLDYDAEFLAGFDWCVASVHSHFRRPVQEQTARVVAAMRHPSVTVIGHLTGRRIGKRPGIDLDIEAVLDVAAETGTAIEINANLDRLDAPDYIIAEGARRGVTFVISTDAHTIGELDNAEFGVRQARRGGVAPDQVANTWPRDRFLAWLGEIRG